MSRLPPERRPPVLLLAELPPPLDAEGFPHVTIKAANFARSGFSSVASSDFLPRAVRNFKVTRRDVVFLDRSISDMNSIQQSKLFEVAEALESIIHALYRLSADGLPTIVIVDQWSHRTIRQGPKPSNLLSRSTASGLYYNVSRHYSLPLWSFKRVLWSEFARVHHAHFITRLLRYGTHPDFG